jgi:hypothetical protein
VHLFYRKYIVDFKTNRFLTANDVIDGLAKYLKNVYNLTNVNVIPNNQFNNLSHISFDDDFNQSIEDLPKTLTSLTFGYCFNQPINNLPSGFW